MPDLSNSTNESAERFEKRCAVEAELRRAFGERKLSLVVGNGALVEWNTWSKEESFEIDYYLSTIKIPPVVRSGEIGPAFVVAETFDKWVTRFPFGMSGRPVPSLTTQIEDWLSEAMKNDPQQKIRAADFRRLARERFPDATKSQVEMAWNKSADKSRTRAGRKPKA